MRKPRNPGGNRNKYLNNKYVVKKGARGCERKVQDTIIEADRGPTFD